MERRRLNPINVETRATAKNILISTHISVFVFVCACVCICVCDSVCDSVCLPVQACVSANIGTLFFFY